MTYEPHAVIRAMLISGLNNSQSPALNGYKANPVIVYPKAGACLLNAAL